MNDFTKEELDLILDAINELRFSKFYDQRYIALENKISDIINENFNKIKTQDNESDLISILFDLGAIEDGKLHIHKFCKRIEDAINDYNNQINKLLDSSRLLCETLERVRANRESYKLYSSVYESIYEENKEFADSINKTKIKIVYE